MGELQQLVLHQNSEELRKELLSLEQQRARLNRKIEQVDRRWRESRRVSLIHKGVAIYSVDGYEFYASSDAFTERSGSLYTNANTGAFCTTLRESWGKVGVSDPIGSKSKEEALQKILEWIATGER